VRCSMTLWPLISWFWICSHEQILNSAPLILVIDIRNLSIRAHFFIRRWKTVKN
jgi:hypothetical protein